MFQLYWDHPEIRVDEIAKMFGVTKQTLYNTFRRLGLDLPQPPKRNAPPGDTGQGRDHTQKEIEDDRADRPEHTSTPLTTD